MAEADGNAVGLKLLDFRMPLAGLPFIRDDALSIEWEDVGGGQTRAMRTSLRFRYLLWSRPGPAA